MAKEDPDQEKIPATTELDEAEAEAQRKADEENAVKFWEEDISSMTDQVGALRDFIVRTTEVSNDVASIGNDLNALRHPVNGVLEGFKVDKKTEKTMDSLGALIGVQAQTARIIEEKIVFKLDNPPDAVDAEYLKEFRKTYLPEGIESNMPNLDGK